MIDYPAKPVAFKSHSSAGQTVWAYPDVNGTLEIDLDTFERPMLEVGYVRDDDAPEPSDAGGES